ncbi:transglutaminase-like domain-containing protein [Arthrobacter russicus]|uniref:Transglutaminase-like putative cysteine protease n=1 Tax=Arthrobacter russicus TaxID=172040 RepID=A0ABU1J7D0_9MICC|nr:transglutaminase family protein [Arthrobacter russicus]MBQ1443958.1 transglutaminase family protein [Renibacterium sp.]MDN5669242.1 transglutaminase family protein [Renibacterium salmoninarum]MDR6268327.1 transglutaminase-like putative cysteine protease [Arthrobacter russicus]
MQRTVSSRLLFATQAQTSVVLNVAVADRGYDELDESVVLLADGQPVDYRELPEPHGGRLFAFSLAEPAEVSLEYRAVVTGTAGVETTTESQLIRYVRPSRYCESDRLLPTSYAEFPGLRGLALLAAVRSWVAQELRYVSGSSRGTDGAVETLLARRGVCRDFAHLAISLLRAKDVPARLAAVYAPGLAPMDFHAVAEAWVDGRWYTIDATGMAPRASMLRISTGRDASDTAFLSTVGGGLTLKEISVSAVLDGDLPAEDPAELVSIG